MTAQQNFKEDILIALIVGILVGVISGVISGVATSYIQKKYLEDNGKKG